MIGGAFASTLIYPFIYEELYNSDLLFEDLAQSQFGLIGAIAAAVEAIRTAAGRFWGCALPRSIPVATPRCVDGNQVPYDGCRCR